MICDFQKKTFVIHSLQRGHRHLWYNMIGKHTTFSKSIFYIAYRASGENKTEALDFVLDIKASGGTNINDALMQGMELIVKGR